MADARPRYSMLIQWSDEDGVFVVSLPEWEDRLFANPVAHGDTYEEAVANGRQAIEALVDWATERGDPLPAPRVLVGV